MRTCDGSSDADEQAEAVQLAWYESDYQAARELVEAGAYPAAAAGFVAVDVPTAVGTCCFAIISIPIELIKDIF